MTETVSMLVPLQTLFGWPPAPTVTPLMALGLLAGAPIVVIVVIFAIAKANTMMKQSKHGPGPQPGDPVWEGGRSKSIMGGLQDQLAEVADEQRRALEAFPSSGAEESATGGASARW